MEETNFNLLKINVWKEFSRFRIYYILEHPNEQFFEINLRNSF